MVDNNNKSVVMFRQDLLPGSETFVRSQFDSLSAWRGTLVGLSKVDSPITRPTDEVLFGSHPREQLRKKVFIYTRQSRSVTRFLKLKRPAVVHAHFAMDGILIAPICTALGIPIIVSVYGIDVTALASRRGVRGAVYRKRLRSLFLRAHKILAVSEYLRNAAVELGAPVEKVIVHRLGIPIPNQEACKPSNTDWDVLVVGRLVEKKGIDDLLMAAALTSPKHGGSLRVAIVGDGPLRGHLENIASEVGASAEFLGSRSPGEIADLMSSTKILAVPSKTATNGDREGLPMILLEGAARSLPIVATRHSGIPEFIQDGVTGLLSDENDVNGLAKNIQRLLEDETLASALAARARKRVIEEYNLLTQTGRLEEFYNEAIGA